KLHIKVQAHLPCFFPWTIAAVRILKRPRCVHRIRRNFVEGMIASSAHLFAMNNTSNPLTRREFLNQTAASVATATVVGSALGSSISRAVESSEQMIGIQTGSISFVDEGIEQVLDLLKQRGA